MTNQSNQQAILTIDKLLTGYGRKKVLSEVSMYANQGEILALIGHNGAGKTTTLKAVFGMLPVWGGEVYFDGQPITNDACSKNVRRGIVYIPQEHIVFPDLTVSDNLDVGAFTVVSRQRADERRRSVYDLLPILEERGDQKAGTLSGGEQKMLSIGIAMMMAPRLLFLDEPSLGLAPHLVQIILDTIKEIATKNNMTVILVEQNVHQALRISDRAYVMRTGKIILEEDSEKMAARGEWWDLF